jgi:DNA polymerase III epsilon subunit-like protein
MENVLILDTETTGTAATDRVVEVGVVLWSVRHGTRVAAYSTLVEGRSNPASHVNQIPAEALVEGADEASVWERLSGWLARADAIVAHQCEFDRRFTPAGWDCGKPWICSMNDIEWPHSRAKKLIEIALGHGLGVARAHRALTDCELVERTLERCHELGHDVGDMLRRAAREKAMVRAVVSYDDRDKAKACGFDWDKDNKRWIRRIAVEDVNAFPFPVERID